MNRSISPRRVSILSRHVLVALAGFACTLPSLAGVSFPNTPLQTATFPPPNVMLDVDDSGSMTWRYIYIHSSSGAFPTISVPKGVYGAGSAATATNTGDESSKDSMGSATDAYGNTDCETNDGSGTVDSTQACVGSSVSGGTYMVDQTYVTNGLYYNPNVSYTPWTYPNGTQQGNAPYTGAYQSHNFSNGYSWTAVDGTTTISLSSPTVNLSTHTQIYYIPKTATDTFCTTLDTTNASCYFRYTILGSTEFPSAAGKIYRADLEQATDVGAVTTPSATTPCNLTGLSSGSNVMTTECNFPIPAGAAQLTITSSGGGSKAVIYERAGAAPTTGTFDKKATSGTAITVASPAAGTYFVALYGNGSAVSGVSITATITYNPVYTVTKGTVGVGCNDTNTAAGTYDWRNCTQVTPTGRSETDERQNFANWYSFYATRMKTAKASISAAFSSLGTIPRVGYRDIWDRLDLDIPVGTDNGLFEDKAATTSPVAPAVVNKTNWFKKVMNEIAYNGTPLRVALNAVGKYYSDADTVNSHTGATGPYGPETGANQLGCRQNFTILTTDGYWNESFSPPAGVGNADDAAGFPYQSSTDSTLADVAWYYYHTDLMTGLANKVPTTTSDTENFQHMVTFTISVGAAGTLNPSAVLAYIASHTAFGGTFTAWPAPTADNVTTIDDLFHAAVNGHGSFVVASNPATFVSALSAALSTIAQRTSASSNVSATSAKLTTTTQLFQSNFVTGLWTGDLFSYPISTGGVVSSTATWQASKLLPPNTTAVGGSTPIAWTARKIFTWNGSSGATFPTATQQAQLAISVGDTTGANYIMGDQSKELSHGGTFRNRSSVLGDLIDSSPAFVPSDTTVSPATKAMIYVGGNDGMLHAFDATPPTDSSGNPVTDTQRGTELFAYVPAGESFANLKTLENSNYIHQYFVDGGIAVSTKAQTTSTSDTVGKNILVGTLGRGGGTVYALDVTNPSTFGAGNVMWEYTDSDMVNALGEPIIARVNTADTGNGNTAVIIGNGYNGSTGHSILYVLNIRTGGLIAKLDSGTGDTTTNPNGMATPTGWDSDRTGTADFLYSGDYMGNVWEFDVSDTLASNWKSVFPASGTAQAMYTAKDASSNRQPITSAMAVGLNPSTFDRWVFFGTGAYLSNGDPANKNTQTWYGLIDPSATTSPSQTPITTVTTRNSTILKQRSVAAYDVLHTANSGTSTPYTIVRAFTPAVAGDMAGKQGWYLDLVGGITYTTDTSTGATAGNILTRTVSFTAQNGERIVTDTVLLAGVLLAASVIPSTDACDPGGTGFINAIDAFTGGPVTNPFFDINGNGSVDSSDTVQNAGTGTAYNGGSIDLGVGMPSLPAFIQKVIAVTGSGGGVGQRIVANPTNSGRISWREVLMGN